MFAYCNNNPVNKIDKTGHMGLSATIAATNFWNPAGAIAGAIFLVEVLVVVIAAAVVYEARDEVADAIKEVVETVDNTLNNKDQSVYVLKDQDDKVRYVGRTNDPGRRAAEHKRDPKHPERQNYTMKVIATGLNIPQAKITEQALISAYTLSYLDNARREIAIGNLAGYYDSLDAVIQIFAGATEDELMNLMGG